MTSNSNDVPLELRVLNTIKEKKPALRNEFDAVVAVLHCVMRELGFICTSLDETISSDGMYLHHRNNKIRTRILIIQISNTNIRIHI